ncbi:MAG: hypothetical protein HYZ92_02545 [Candidatus Omnitrophica bacterium]|nr:hypothetical protein [Candidatus Omnitrophota bacterium]
MQLSEQERREMLDDAHSAQRRAAFRISRRAVPAALDELLAFLDGVQHAFKPWPVSRRPSRTDRNKL